MAGGLCCRSCFFFSSRRRHTRWPRDWSSDVCSSDLLAGQGLEPNSERQINLVGPDVIVPFDAVTTDGEGMFSVTLTIPAHLPAGTYTFQAIGDETLTTDCTITAAEGQAAAEPKNEAAATVTTRSRSGLELGIIAVL